MFYKFVTILSSSDEFYLVWTGFYKIWASMKRFRPATTDFRQDETILNSFNRFYSVQTDFVQYEPVVV